MPLVEICTYKKQKTYTHICMHAYIQEALLTQYFLELKSFSDTEMPFVEKITSVYIHTHIHAYIQEKLLTEHAVELKSFLDKEMPLVEKITSVFGEETTRGKYESYRLIKEVVAAVCMYVCMHAYVCMCVCVYVCMCVCIRRRDSKREE